MPDLIESVSVVTVRSPLPMTIRFGQWVMTHREFALARIRTEAGLEGFGFVYTRDGPLAAIVRRNIAPLLIGQPYDDPAALHWQAAWSNNAILASGIGLRALGLVDLATWDLAARAQQQSISAYLGGERRPMPVTAIIGYPPSLTPEQVAAQVETYLEAGWRRFKQPIAGTLEDTRARLRAARRRSATGTAAWRSSRLRCPGQGDAKPWAAADPRRRVQPCRPRVSALPARDRGRGASKGGRMVSPDLAGAGQGRRA